MSPRARARALLLTAAVVALAGCGTTGTTSASPSDVLGLAPDGVPPSMTVGVVVSLTSDPGQGSDWSDGAEGAQVAAYRYGVGGVRVRLRAVNDKGTAAGARSAVRELVDDHVSGIVMATGGDHVMAGLQEAARAGVPVLLPYAEPAGPMPATTWSTGPDADQVGAALAGALRAAGHRRVLLVNAGGGSVPHLSPVATLDFAAGQDANALARTVAGRASTRHLDAVVVSGPAQLQAQVVAGLQGAGGALPVLLTPAALTPAFSADLVQAGGSLSADLVTVGVAGLDTSTLQPGSEGRSASAFFAALRAAADAPHLQDFFDAQPFAEVADAADSRSHDAVVALVTAAAQAGNRDARRVASALSHLRVTTADGLAGPALDFATPEAVGDDALTVLHATTQDPGVLPDAGPARIHWFATPAS